MRLRTQVASEIDVLSGVQYRSADVTARLIEENRTARLVALGEDFVTGEEMDWFLAAYAPRDRIVAEVRKQITDWLRKQGHEDIADDVEYGVWEASA